MALLLSHPAEIDVIAFGAVAYSNRGGFQFFDDTFLNVGGVLAECIP